MSQVRVLYSALDKWCGIYCTLVICNRTIKIYFQAINAVSAVVMRQIGSALNAMVFLPILIHLIGRNVSLVASIKRYARIAMKLRKTVLVRNFIN